MKVAGRGGRGAYSCFITVIYFAPCVLRKLLPSSLQRLKNFVRMYMSARVSTCAACVCLLVCLCAFLCVHTLFLLLSPLLPSPLLPFLSLSSLFFQLLPPLTLN